MTLAAAIVWQRSTSHSPRLSEAERAEPERSRSALSSSERSGAGRSSTELPSLEPDESFANLRGSVSRETRSLRAGPEAAGVGSLVPPAAHVPHVPRTVLPVAPSVASVPSPRLTEGAPALRARPSGERADPAPKDVLAGDADALGALADMFVGDAVRTAVSATRRSAQPKPPSRK
jgi:hypothetical protein